MICFDLMMRMSGEDLCSSHHDDMENLVVISSDDHEDYYYYLNHTDILKSDCDNQAGSHSTPENTVVVQWDSGSRTNYRTGYQKSYDLRILDNAPVGVRHPNISCNSCGKHGIAGIRWKCTSCPNYDLCSNCYMSDKHDLNHSFTRFDTSNSIG